MKIAITGVTGWLGQSSLHAIRKLRLIESIDELTLFGSRSRIFKDPTYGDLNIQRLREPHTMQGSADLFVHLAFKTRDYLAKMTSTDYMNENRRIIENSIFQLKVSRPKSVILVSSGVVSRHLSTLGQRNLDPYTELKMLEEALFTEACVEIGATLFVLRLWGASGEQMTEPRKYAIGDLIYQALHREQITVTSTNKVYRRYTDASQLMEVSILAAIEGRNEIVDSGGEIIEMGTLASRVGELLSPGKPIMRREILGLVPDVYLSTSVRMEELADKYSVPFYGIDEQIRRTAMAVTRENISIEDK